MDKMKNFVRQLGMIVLHFSVFAFFFWIASLCTWLWLQVTMFLLLGVVALISFVFLFLKDKGEIYFSFSRIFIGLGIMFGVGFGIWFINVAMHLMSLLMKFLGLSFQVGWVFSEIGNIIFSVPSLIAGALLCFAGLIMKSSEYDDKQEKIYQDALEKNQLAAKQAATI